ncbi:MAG: WD40 repeat domain-containing protein, partial [Okeania sp. SIO2H7]|nr:WD40 repeat domain-containing protein [Okeania sp. SIO2H7]
LNRIEKGEQTEEDINVLPQLFRNGDRQVAVKLGKYNVKIGEGQDIHIGDRTYYGWNEEAIKALVKAIQQVNWQCVASLTENDSTYVEFQSTGISLIDKLAKNLADFSEQSVMRYGLKLAFSPDPNQEYFINGGSQILKLWHKPKNTWEIKTEIPLPGISDLWLTSVAISPDSKLIAACKSYQIKIWRFGEEKALYTLGKTMFSNFLDVAGFDSVTFSSDSKILAANDNKNIKLWDVETGREIVELSGHSDKVTCVTFNPKNGSILASCSYDKTIKLWNIAEKKCLGTLSAHRDAVYSLAFRPDGEILASGSDDNSIKLWNLNAGEMPQTLRQHEDAVTCLVFSPDGETLISGSNDGKIIAWNLLEQEAEIFPEKHRRGVTSIAMSPDGKTLISGGRDQTIKVWKR